MKTTAAITILIIAIFLSAAEAQNKKCQCRGKRGPRGPRGLRGKTGPPGGGANCKLVRIRGPANSVERQTGSLDFSIPLIAVTSSCPEGFTSVTCECGINSPSNGKQQVRTKLVTWGVFSSRSCICNYEYLPGFDEKVQLFAQVVCIKLECS